MTISHRYPPIEARDPFLPLAEFEEITLYPPSNRNQPNVDWPDFHNQYAARHLWQGKPQDWPPVTDLHPAARFEEPANYMGPFEHHFGHFTMERVTRIPQAELERPGRPFVLNDGPAVHRKRIPEASTRCQSGWSCPATGSSSSQARRRSRISP